MSRILLVTARTLFPLKPIARTILSCHEPFPSSQRSKQAAEFVSIPQGVIVQGRPWKNGFKLLVFVVFMALLTSILTVTAPEAVGGKTTWDRGWSAFSALLVLSGMTLLAIYPLLVRLRRALVPVAVKNQVAALMELSKDANWDANDMGRKLSKLSAWSPANGEQLARGVLLAGFPTKVLEEFAKKQNEQDLFRIVVEHRKEEHDHLLNLLLFAPWLALIAFFGLPLFVKAFFTWTLTKQAVFVGIWLFIYGAIPAKTLVEIVKGK